MWPKYNSYQIVIINFCAVCMQNKKVAFYYTTVWWFFITSDSVDLTGGLMLRHVKHNAKMLLLLLVLR